jgi:magnesium-transporting ATPase (P-type)
MGKAVSDGSPVVRPTVPAIDPRRAAVLAADAVLAAVGSRPEGLTSEEATGLLRVVGPNLLPTRRATGPLRKLLAQVTHFFALMLWVAAILAFVGGMPQLAVAIVIVVIVNGIFSFTQEERAARAAAALADMLPDEAAVLRDSHRTKVPAATLVPGDVLLLREGARISADARVLESAGLLVDNAALTGESVPVSRDAAASSEPPDDPVDASDLIFAGTFVAAGSARAVVVATAGHTRLGGIAQLTGDVVRRPSPLKRDLDRAVKIIGACAIAAGVVFFGISLTLGTAPRDGFLFSVGVIVALVPEGLLPTLTLALAMSATRMAHRGALVRRSEAVETLGATTAICSDKTGTMTTSQMTARALVAAGHQVRTTRSGWAPGGTLLEDERPLSAGALEDVRPALRVASLCADARLEQSDGRYRCVGDPTEGALVVLARKGGVEREPTERTAHRVIEFPFDSDRRRMTTVHQLADGSVEILTKGSPEAVTAVCSAVRTPGGACVPFDDEQRRALDTQVELLAQEGLRVLALARRTESGTPPTTPAEAERDLELVGLAGMEDPIRPEVPPAIERWGRGGIPGVVLTGDHPATAASVAARVGLEGDRVLTGPELPADDLALRSMLADPRVGVLARIVPEQKLRITRALQSGGLVVAMTGDGVNDAPALRQADIGVAMGITGTDVAREAADLVLLDDNFAHIVEAVEEGRAAFDNIRRFLTYHLTDNVAELAPFILWALSGGRIPLLISVLQVLALDIGTDLLPALALGAERPPPWIMDRVPRRIDEHLLNRHVLTRAFGFLGPVEAVVSLAIAWVGAAVFFGWQPGAGLPPRGTPALATLSAMVFASIVMMQMANAFACRSTTASVFTIGPFTNRLLNGAVVVEAAALLAFIYVPPIYRALGGRPLTAAQWVPVLVTPWILLGAEEARKARLRRRVPAARRGPPGHAP